MGLYLVFIAPGLFDETMNKLILQQTKQATNMTAGPLSRLYVGSLYSGVEMLAGLTLISLSAALYAGKKWAWSLALLLLSIPTMANGYIGLGWLENLKKFPPAYITFFLSLFAFWAMLLLKENDKKTKNAMFWVFTLIGMLGTQGFMLFPHALRVILKDPASALGFDQLFGDCQSQPAAADVTGAGFVFTPEAVEYVGQVCFGDTGAVVANGERDGDVGFFERKPDIAAGRGAVQVSLQTVGLLRCLSCACLFYSFRFSPLSRCYCLAQASG